MKERLKLLWDELLLLLYPRPLSCLHCGSSRMNGEAVLCPRCLEELRKQVPSTGFTVRGEIDAGFAARRYAGPAGTLVRRLKYDAVSEPVGEMAEAMWQALVRFDADRKPDRVTYVPMHPSRERSRPYNHAELLARGVAAHWDLKPEPLLRRVRRTGRQATITGEARRAENVRGAFRSSGRLDGERILLIDDVYTTGATARECAEALKLAGAACVDVLVYALSHGGNRNGAGSDPASDPGTK